jgi:hypothetical protein
VPIAQVQVGELDHLRAQGVDKGGIAHAVPARRNG